jgi:DNA repair exonuclease SbcCD ATPase subunit
MEKELLFRLSDNDKARKIASALNPNFNEEGGWKFEYYLMDVYADYAVAASVDEDKYIRAYYTVNADESVTVGEKMEVEITDVTKDEMLALEALKAINNNLSEVKETYDANVKAIENLTAEKEEINSQLTEANKTVEEKVTEIETLNNSLEETKKELEAIKAEKASLETLNSDLNKEKEELAQFKANIETEQKKSILEKYSEYISSEKYSTLENDVANYSVEDFEKEVCVAAVKNTPTIFSKQEQSQTLIYTGNADDVEKGNSALEDYIDKTLGGNK